MVTFKVKQQPSSPKNNEAWQFEFPERTVRGLLQSSQHWTSLWILSCSFHNFVYVCCGTCLERHLEHWNTALSPNMKRKYNIHPPDCLQTPEEESIKHNIGFFLSLRLPMGFETPMWHWRVYSHIWKHQSFILMFELISGEHLQNKKIWCCPWDLWPSEIPQPVFKSMFWGMHFNSP